VEFMPGAFAYHLHSFSAATLRSTDHNWVGPLLARGATATMGCVDEPYIVGTPDMSVFFKCLVRLGFTYGEAAYSDQRFLSWQTTVVGDPLYRPFGKPLSQQIEALQTTHSPLIEWAWLRVANLRLLSGVPMTQVADALDDLPAAHQSPVLMEKLGDLFARLGKPSSSVRARQSALKLLPTPEQRMRLELALAEQLVALDRQPEAYETYQKFVADNPDYPDLGAAYRRLEDLAARLGHKDEAAKYAREIARLAAPASSSK
jgi:tetratricopeptide (TPR) repeat protein